MDNLEQRVATKLREALDVCIDDGDGAIDATGLAQVVIAAVNEQASDLLKRHQDDRPKRS